MISEPYEVTEKRREEELQQQASEIHSKARPEGRYTVNDAIILLLAETGDYHPLGKAVESGAVPCYAHEEGDKKGDLNDQRSWVCWDDLNKWIDEETDIRKFRFPKAERKASLNTKKMWVAAAWEHGRIYVNEWRKAGYEPTVADVGLYVEGIFSNNGTYNTNGNVIDRATIVREALTGITGKKKGQKSTKQKIPNGEKGKLPQK